MAKKAKVKSKPKKVTAKKVDREQQKKVVRSLAESCIRTVYDKQTDAVVFIHTTDSKTAITTHGSARNLSRTAYQYLIAIDSEDFDGWKQAFIQAIFDRRLKRVTKGK